MDSEGTEDSPHVVMDGVVTQVQPMGNGLLGVTDQQEVEDPALCRRKDLLHRRAWNTPSTARIVALVRFFFRQPLCLFQVFERHNKANATEPNDLTGINLAHPDTRVVNERAVTAAQVRNGQARSAHTKLGMFPRNTGIVHNEIARGGSLQDPTANDDEPETWSVKTVQDDRVRRLTRHLRTLLRIQAERSGRTHHWSGKLAWPMNEYKQEGSSFSHVIHGPGRGVGRTSGCLLIVWTRTGWRRPERKSDRVAAVGEAGDAGAAQNDWTRLTRRRSMSS
jgi:hypothetical protein